MPALKPATIGQKFLTDCGQNRPLTTYEYKQGDKSEAYDDYSVYGGLPAVALMATEEQKSSHLTTKTFDCS